MIEWNNSLVIGLREIDQHHKHLVEFLNATYQAAQEGASMADMDYAIAEMLEYTDEHFSREERWMAEAGYPGLARHKQEHGIFALQAQELQDKRNGLAAVEIIGFLSDWIRCHILNTDADFRLFLDGQDKSRQLSGA